MKEIEAEGMKYIYFTKSEGLPDQVLKEPSVDESGMRLVWNEILAHNLADIRLVLINSAISPDQKSLYYLHWNDSTDL